MSVASGTNTASARKNGSACRTPDTTQQRESSSCRRVPLCGDEWPALPSTPLRHLLGEIAIPGQPALRRELVDTGEESLQTVEVRLSLTLDERRAMCLACIVPAAGDRGRILGDIFAAQQAKPRLGNEPFVLAGRQEEVEADGTPNGNLLV